MSTVIACHRCDRCGKERPPDPEPKETGEPVTTKETSWLRISIYNLHERELQNLKTTIPDLCTTCSEDFIRWFKDGGKTITL